ncbi:MAG TPA: hypothetical protein QGI62_08895, partial [Anaerolineales bacterium]|nr:hypothetical protein [Anaerolineales bacterium]
GIYLPNIGKRRTQNATSALAAMESARHFMIQRWLLTIELPYCSRKKELILRSTNAHAIGAGTYQRVEINKTDQPEKN